MSIYHIGDVVHVTVPGWGRDMYLLIMSEATSRMDQIGVHRIWYNYVNLEDGVTRDFEIGSLIAMHMERVV